MSLWVQDALRCKLTDMKAERDCLAADVRLLRRQLTAAEDPGLQLAIIPLLAGAPSETGLSMQTQEANHGLSFT